MAPVALPPGFRFHPTDEELVAYFLKRKACGLRIEFDVIGEQDLYKAEPWDLPDKSLLKTKDGEWYFFCARDKKYPNGSRANRATEMGYWKATGKDRKVCSGARTVGMKKTLVFYKGRAPRGERTDWVMHEYRLDEDFEKARSIQSAFVLCRIFKKGGPGPRNGEQYGAPLFDDDEANGTPEEVEPKMLYPIEDGADSVPSDPQGVLNEAFDDIDRYLEELSRNDHPDSLQGLGYLIDEGAGVLHTPVLTDVIANGTDGQVVEGEPSKVTEKISPHTQDLAHTFNLDDFPPVPNRLDFETGMEMAFDDFIHPAPEEADILEEILHSIVANEGLRVPQEREVELIQDENITGLEIFQDADSLALRSLLEGDFLELDDLEVPLDALDSNLEVETQVGGMIWPTIDGAASHSSLQQLDTGIEIRGRTRWPTGNHVEPVEQGVARRRIRLERRAPDVPIGLWMNNSELCLSPESLDRPGVNGDHQHVSTYEHISVPEVRRFDAGESSDSGMSSHQAVNPSNSENKVGDGISGCLKSIPGSSLVSSTGPSCSSSSQMQIGGVYLDLGNNLKLSHPKIDSSCSFDESYVFIEPVRDSLGLFDRPFDAANDSENDSDCGRSSAALSLLSCEIPDSEGSSGAWSNERGEFSDWGFSSQLSRVVVESFKSSAPFPSTHRKCLQPFESGLDILRSDTCREGSRDVSHEISGDYQSPASVVQKMPAVSSSAGASHQLSKPLQKLLELFGTIPTLPAIAAELTAELRPKKFAEEHEISGDYQSPASAVEKMPAVPSSAGASHQLSKPLQKLLELFGTIPTLPAIAAELPAELKPKKFAENENFVRESGPLNTTVMSAVFMVTSPLSRHGVAQLEGSQLVKSSTGVASSSCSVDRGYSVYAEEKQSPGAEQKPCEMCSCAQGSTGKPSLEESLKRISHLGSFGIKYLRAFKRTFVLLFLLGTTSALFFSCLLREVRRFSRCMLTTML